MAVSSSVVEAVEKEACHFMRSMASLLSAGAYELLLAVNYLEDHIEAAGGHVHRAPKPFLERIEF